jgi:hypothetical protein
LQCGAATSDRNYRLPPASNRHYRPKFRHHQITITSSHTPRFSTRYGAINNPPEHNPRPGGCWSHHSRKCRVARCLNHSADSRHASLPNALHKPHYHRHPHRPPWLYIHPPPSIAVPRVVHVLLQITPSDKTYTAP